MAEGTVSRLGRVLNPLRRVRSSDGRTVAFSFDRAALVLHSLSWLMAVMALMAAMWTEGHLYWLGCAAIGYVADVGARQRLGRSVTEAESLGVAAGDVAYKEPWNVRLLEWFAVQCHNSENKYLAKAAQSDANGRSRAAERFRKRAAWTRNEAERNRRGAQQLRSRGGFRL